jgi:signal transduction histidine kinase
VQVGIRTENGQVLFEVRDDGPGVDAGLRDRIFEPGFSAHQAGDATASGAGLGLPLARRLARAAGGDVDCAAPPDGAMFIVRLPAA